MLQLVQIITNPIIYLIKKILKLLFILCIVILILSNFDIIFIITKWLYNSNILNTLSITNKLNITTDIPNLPNIYENHILSDMNINKKDNYIIVDKDYYDPTLINMKINRIEQFDILMRPLYPNIKTTQYQNTVIKVNGKNNNLWHLDILDGLMDGKYSFNKSGKNVTIILLDNYVNTHQDFINRSFMINDKFVNSPNVDIKTKNHGVSMMGSSIGKIYGVAKDANILMYQTNYNEEHKLIEINRQLFEDIVRSTRTICNPKHKCILLMPFVVEYDSQYETSLSSYLDPIRLSNSYIMIAPIGNDNSDLNIKPVFPACESDVLSVGSYVLDIKLNINNSFKKIIYEGILKINPKINKFKNTDLYAPGHDIITTGLNNKIIITSGTSISSSIVAGWVATLLESDPSLDVNSIRGRIKLMNKLV